MGQAAALGKSRAYAYPLVTCWRPAASEWREPATSRLVGPRTQIGWVGLRGNFVDAAAMRLQRIAVTNLFGLFDHEVRLNTAPRITILHGPNGFGKTALLKMVYGFLRGRYAVFESIPFATFELEFSPPGLAHAHVRITRQRPGNEEMKPSLLFELLAQGKPTETYLYKRQAMFSNFGEGNLTVSDAPTSAPSFRFTSEPLTSPSISFHWPIGEYPPEPEWLTQLHDPAVRLIETKRLETETPDPERSRRRRKTVLTVEHYSRALVREIAHALSAYAAFAQERDRTFPIRILSGNRPAKPLDEVRSSLVGLDRARAALARLGLLDLEGSSQQIPDHVDPTRVDVLAVYAEDVGKKLSAFDSIASKLTLLLEIINTRFKYKQLSVSREHGFSFRTLKGDPLPVASLSSGEQHELVLVYELLFEAPKDSLVLIDEPEISLHVAWQSRFLPDLERILAIAACDVLIATHSPEIIGKRWDLAYELRGPELGNAG